MTLRELSEELLLETVLEDYIKANVEREPEWKNGPKINRDEKAKALADTPIYTGHADFDRWEREETDPNRPPLNFDG